MILVSVIIPFHKNLKELNKAVKSVLNQDKDDQLKMEIIIGNDSNYSCLFLEQFLKNNENTNFKIVNNEKQKGAGNARNAALSKAKGDYIAFLDADDIWQRDKLKIQLEIVKKGFTFITTNYKYLPSYKRIKSPVSIVSYKDFFFKGPVGTSTVLITRELLGDTKFTNLSFCQDLIFWSNLAKKNIFNYSNVNKFLVNYSLGGRTSKTNYFKRAYYYYIACKEVDLSFFNTILALINYGIKGFKNRTLSFMKDRFKKL